MAMKTRFVFYSRFLLFSQKGTMAKFDPTIGHHRLQKFGNHCSIIDMVNLFNFGLIVALINFHFRVFDGLHTNKIDSSALINVWISIRHFLPFFLVRGRSTKLHAQRTSKANNVFYHCNNDPPFIKHTRTRVEYKNLLFNWETRQHQQHRWW